VDPAVAFGLKESDNRAKRIYHSQSLKLEEKPVPT
jgi:hypothetical protein